MENVGIDRQVKVSNDQYSMDRNMDNSDVRQLLNYDAYGVSNYKTIVQISIKTCLTGRYDSGEKSGDDSDEDIGNTVVNLGAMSDEKKIVRTIRSDYSMYSYAVFSIGAMISGLCYSK